MNRIFAAALAVFCVGAMAFPILAAAQADPLNPAAPAAVAAPVPETLWLRRCETPEGGKEYCEIFQNLSMQQKGSESSQRVAEFAIGVAEDGKKKKPAGILILPLGIMVDGTVEGLIDDKHKFAATVKYCLPSGCYAHADLTPSIIDRMRKGEKIVIKSKAASGQAVDIVMGLKGFAKAAESIGL